MLTLFPRISPRFVCVFKRGSSGCPPCHSIAPSISIFFHICILFLFVGSLYIFVHSLFYTLPHVYAALCFPFFRVCFINFCSSSSVIIDSNSFCLSWRAARWQVGGCHLSKIQGLLGKLRARVMLANYSTALDRWNLPPR